ncbi:LPS-assembly protein LptD [Noviherbaspirillum galbum]|uniref:LPS-assembly protein LptD n=1 Tax=Noviherbaspirillum galbum TaxID=2709383 RepID=A0A6B3SSI1_9BURK|nr:LPS-assembly protein LptD [Noviherbaspirillum galbum]NEX61402.1 LPS-assembly protein LptD [Noviherbaspirillum galbum]
MNRFPAFPPSQFLLTCIALAVAAAFPPAFAQSSPQPAPQPPAQPQPGVADDKNAPANVSAEQMTGRPDREVILERDVEIIRGATTVNADRATYRIPEDEVEAEGNVRMRRFGDRYSGDELKLRMDAGQGYVLNPSYRLERNNAQGKADRIDFYSQEQATVTDGTYSTCEGPDPDWYLKASKLDLDTGRDEGIARSSVVYFKGLPILGAPALSFPLSDARKSGFLPPTIGTTNKGGVEVTVPYYVNIAPNRDLTLYPKLFARRGLQLGAEGRYLGESYNGQTRVEVLPNDQQTRTTRYSLSSLHTHILGPGLWYNWNINTASDDDYPSDFSRTITAGSQRLLLRDFNFNYVPSPMLSTTVRLSNYQVLQDPAAPIVRPYDRLPQININAGRQDVNGFDWNIDSELTRFWHPDLLRANRLVINPRLSYPVIQPGYFVTPRVSLHATTYRLDSPLPTGETSLSRVLPTFSLDSGLIFERNASFFGQRMTQTLEPRLFYVYTPYRDQSAFPLFDTAEADLSFAQLFSENRFVGSDRISDANQLTAAVISRYIEENGAERMRFAIGQRFYFTDQRVTLGTARNDSRSDLLLSANGQLTDTLSVEGNIQYSQTAHQMSRANYGTRWSPAPRSVLNLQYRRDVLNNLEQVDMSAQWPIARRWYGVGRVNYSLPDRKVAEGLAGFEYKADCWVFRVVAQRTPTATEKATTSLYFQLELNGLTRLGSNPLEALRTSIPGYQLVNQPTTPSPR